MTELYIDEKIVESSKLPYGGDYYRAQELGDYNSQREIMRYRRNKEIIVSLPVVTVNKNNCELEIIYLNKQGSVENSICVIRSKLSFGNVMYMFQMPVYEWDSVYYYDIEILQNNTKVVAIPISINPQVYYLVKKKSYDKDTAGVLYGIYTKLYWNKNAISTDISYSLFERLSTANMIKDIIDINAS